MTEQSYPKMVESLETVCQLDEAEGKALHCQMRHSVWVRSSSTASTRATEDHGCKVRRPGPDAGR